jgi:hypothetical protein
MCEWQGWLLAAETAGASALAWDDWRAWQRRFLDKAQRQHAHQCERMPFSEPELARLSFVRWLHQSGRLDPTRATPSESDAA